MLDTRTLIRAEARLIQACEDISKETGIKLTFHGTRGKRRSLDRVTALIEIEPDLSDAEKAESFAIIGRRFGLSKDDYGRVFHSGRHSYKIVDLNPMAHTCPLIVERLSNGKQYKMPLHCYPLSREFKGQ